MHNIHLNQLRYLFTCIISQVPPSPLLGISPKEIFICQLCLSKQHRISMSSHIRQSLASQVILVISENIIECFEIRIISFLLILSCSSKDKTKKKKKKKDVISIFLRAFQSLFFMHDQCLKAHLNLSLQYIVLSCQSFDL